MMWLWGTALAITGIFECFSHRAVTMGDLGTTDLMIGLVILWLAADAA